MLITIRLEDKSKFYVVFHAGGNCVEIKTEADSNDITVCSYDIKPSTGIGMFCYFFMLYSLLLFMSVCCFSMDSFFNCSSSYIFMLTLLPA